MLDTVLSSLLEESPYWGSNFGVYARQMGTFFKRNHTMEKIPIARNRIRVRFQCYPWYKVLQWQRTTFSLCCHFSINWRTWVCMEWVPSEKTGCKEHLKRKPGEYLITHLMETICLLPGETTKLSSLPPTICR